MTDSTPDLEPVEAHMRDEAPLIDVAMYVPALVAEVRRLRAQRDAALAVCDKWTKTYGYTPSRSGYGSGVIAVAGEVRAALGVQPEPAEQT